MQCNPSYWEYPGLQTSSVCRASWIAVTDLGSEHSSWATLHWSSSLLSSTLSCSAPAISCLLVFKEQSALSPPPLPPPISCLPGDLLEANWASLDLTSSLPTKQVPVWIKDLALANTVSYVRQLAARTHFRNMGNGWEGRGNMWENIDWEESHQCCFLVLESQLYILPPIHFSNGIEMNNCNSFKEKKKLGKHLKIKLILKFRWWRHQIP